MPQISGIFILPESGVSRCTVLLFQIIRYKKFYGTCYKYVWLDYL